MNKKVIAVAIATAFAASGAYADATLYGKMHGSVDMIDAQTAEEDNWQVNSRASRIGVKGSEDLGDGLKAIYQLELGFNLDGQGQGQDGASSNGVFGSKTRNTFVGFAGDWGTGFIGRHDTPAKVAFYGAGVENLGDSAIDLNTGNNLNRKVTSNSSASPIGVISEYRANDVIAYVSPNFAGFTFIAAAIPGEDDKNVEDKRDGIADHYSFGAIYKGGGLKASLGYANYNSGDPANSPSGDGDVDQKVAQASASYTFGGFKIGGTYEYTDNYIWDDKSDYNAFAVTGQYNFGNNAISVAYTDGNYNSKENNGLEKTGWGVGLDHAFSKRTKVYAAYASAKIEPDQSSNKDDDIFSLGMIHNF